MKIRIKIPFQKRYLTVEADNIPPWLIGTLAIASLLVLTIKVIHIHL
jgi:hypothetical protein